MWNSFSVSAMLTAGVYLVVRGLDNVHQGLTKDPKDPIGTKLFSYLSASLIKPTEKNVTNAIIKEEDPHD